MATLHGKSDSGFLVEEGTLVFSGETIKPADIAKLLCTEIDEGNKELIKKLKELAKRLGEAGKERKGKAITQETGILPATSYARSTLIFVCSALC